MVMDQPTATIVGALVGFLGGLVVARSAYQQKSEELFFKALDFLGGGSQKRNLGVAAIELYWTNKRHRPVSVSLLIGSALYLLLESKQQDAAHELHNLERIMKILQRKEARLASSRTQYELLNAAVNTALIPKPTGVTVPSVTLNAWSSALTSLMNLTT
jgi:hypothetical protein